MTRQNPSEAQLRAVVSKHFGAGMRDARVVHHHCNTHAYITLDDETRVVIRICDGPWWTEKPDQIDKFVAERFAWNTLEAVGRILTPQVIAIETDEAIVSYPFLIMTHVPGTPMNEVFATLQRDEQIHLLEELGAVVRDIHALPFDPATVPAEAMRWEGLGDCLQRHVHQLHAQGLMTDRARERFERLLDACSSRLADMDEDIVFMHGDIHFGNLLLQQSDGRWHIGGLVDAELAGIGPRGRELRALEPFSFRRLAVPGMRDAFLRGYGEGLGRDDYKLAYLTAELEPDFPNRELLRVIESADFSEDLDWIQVFADQMDATNSIILE